MELLQTSVEAKNWISENEDNIRLIVSGFIFLVSTAGTFVFSTLVNVANKDGSAGLLLPLSMMLSLGVSFGSGILFLVSLWHMFGLVYGLLVAAIFILSFLYMKQVA
nr:hypothetical protein 2 [Gammaproteobacteria bacterium]